MKLSHRSLALALLLGSLAGAASAQTVTVTTSADVSDVPVGATVADLPGPDGVVSMREALRASDNTPGRQTIGFAIPEADWYLSDIFPGRVLLQASFNLSAFDAVTIDGTTQTAFTGDTFPGGWEVGVYGLQLVLNGDDSEVFGLESTRVTVFGSNADVHDNTGNMRIDLYNGSGSTVHDNVADTITINASDDNVVVANTLDRVRVTGGPPGAPSTNNRIGGPDPADRNFITGWGNFGEHGVPAGTTVELINTSGTLIQNNYIGTTPDGMAIGNPASTVGVGVISENAGVTIRDNLIAIHATNAFGSGDYGVGVFVENDEGGAGVHLFGNTIGLDAAGAATLGGLQGVYVTSLGVEFAQDVRIGGTGAGEGNVVAGHVSTGVLIEGFPGIVPLSGVRVSGNSIHGNGEIGIDLTPNTWTYGPTANDPGDADDGANGLQNHPVLSSATRVGPTLLVAGSLQSEPLTDYTVELFASPACDASGFGQAEVFLGSTFVVTDAAGDASFDETFPASVPSGWVVTATATREPDGATSELSACVPLTRVGASFCDAGDGALAACPCGNAGSPDTGCDLQQGTGGVGLAVLAQETSPSNRATLCAAGYPVASTPSAVVIRAPSLDASAIVFGDGVRCVGLPVVRLGAAFASGGMSEHTLGHGATAGSGTFHYQVWLRNTPAMFCSPESFNLSNGVSLSW